MTAFTRASTAHAARIRWPRGRHRRAPPPSTRATSSRSTRARRRGEGDPRHRAPVRPRARAAGRSATGSSRESFRASSSRSSRSSASSACTSTATAAGHELRRVRAHVHGARGRRLRRPQRSSPCRARWRCTRSGAGAPRSRSSAGSRRWHEGEAIGCFGLTEPDAGSDPGAMRTTRTTRRLRLDPQRLEDVDHERDDRRRRDRLGAHRRGRDPRLPRREGHEGLQRAGDPQEALAARLGHLRARARRRARARGRDVPRGAVAARAALVPQRGALRHRLGRHRRRARVLRGGARLRQGARAFGKPIAAYQLIQQKLAEMRSR